MSARTQPSHTHLVEVCLRPEFADAEGAGALALLHGQGLSAIKEARAGRLYEIKGPLTANQVLQAAKDLLCDGVTQEHRVVSPSAGFAVATTPMPMLTVMLTGPALVRRGCAAICARNFSAPARA